MSGNDLVAFLLARIDDDEKHAHAEEHYNPDDSGYYSCPAVHTQPYGDLPWGEENCDCGLAARKNRALAEAAAKRAILELHHVEEHWAVWSDMPDDASGSEREGCMVCTLGPSCPHPPAEEDVVYPCRTLRLLASVYADHPDYDPSWKPESD